MQEIGYALYLVQKDERYKKAKPLKELVSGVYELVIDKRHLKQVDAAKILSVDQLKVSALSCGRFDDFSIERLIDFLNGLDRDVEILVKKKVMRSKIHSHVRVALADRRRGNEPQLFIWQFINNA